MVNTQLSDSPPPYDDEDIHLYLRNDLEDDLEDNLDIDENVIDNECKKKIERLLEILCGLTFIGIFFVIFFLYTKPYVIDTCTNRITNSSCVNEYICDDDNNCGYVNLCKDNDKCNSLATLFTNLFFVTLIPSIILLVILNCLCDRLMNYFYLHIF